MKPESRRQYRQEHRAELAEKQREYAAKNREKIRAYFRDRLRSDPEWAALRRKAANDRYYANRAEALAAGKEYRGRNAAAISNRKRATYRADVPQMLLSSARRRAAERRVPFDLALDDVVVPERCPVLGIPLVVGNGRLEPGSPTIDRIVPERGYVRGNVAVISHKANLIKNDGTIAEHEMIVAWMQRTSMSQ